MPSVDRHDKFQPENKRWYIEDVSDYQGRNWSGNMNRGYQMVYTLEMKDPATKKRVVVHDAFSRKYNAIRITPEIEKDMLNDATLSARKKSNNYSLKFAAIVSSKLRVWRVLSKNRKPGKVPLPKRTSQAARFEMVDPVKKHWRDRVTGKVYSNGQYVRKIKKGHLEDATPLKR
jgi:hypothetical protein